MLNLSQVQCYHIRPDNLCQPYASQPATCPCIFAKQSRVVNKDVLQALSSNTNLSLPSGCPTRQNGAEICVTLPSQTCYPHLGQTHSDLGNTLIFGFSTEPALTRSCSDWWQA